MSLFAPVAARLIEKARTVADARLVERRMEQSDPAGRWRRAALLWPLFTKG